MLFCGLYVKTNNATESYISAGYSKQGADVSACRLLKKDEICSEIARRREKATVHVDLTVAEVLQNLQNGMTMAKELGQTAAYMKGVELQAKYLGMLTERRELTGRAGGPMQVDSTVRQGVLTQEERDQLKAKLKGVLD